MQDRFHSKKPTFNSYEAFLARLQDKFETWSKRFGLPDIKTLAERYGQPIDSGVIIV